MPGKGLQETCAYHRIQTEI